MSNIATTLEQSRRLLELGLDPKSADMLYVYFGEDDYGLEVANEFDDKLNKLFNAETIPAWTLSALLELMDEVSLDKHGDCYNMDFAYKGIFTDTHFNPIDAAVQIVEMMMVQGLINKVG